jgi:hypothetical protein
VVDAGLERDNRKAVTDCNPFTPSRFPKSETLMELSHNHLQAISFLAQHSIFIWNAMLNAIPLSLVLHPGETKNLEELSPAEPSSMQHVMPTYAAAQRVSSAWHT